MTDKPDGKDQVSRPLPIRTMAISAAIGAVTAFLGWTALAIADNPLHSDVGLAAFVSLVCFSLPGGIAGFIVALLATRRWTWGTMVVGVFWLLCSTAAGYGVYQSSFLRMLYSREIR